MGDYSREGVNPGRCTVRVTIYTTHVFTVEKVDGTLPILNYFLLLPSGHRVEHRVDIYRTVFFCRYYKYFCYFIKTLSAIYRKRDSWDSQGDEGTGEGVCGESIRVIGRLFCNRQLRRFRRS